MKSEMKKILDYSSSNFTSLLSNAFSSGITSLQDDKDALDVICYEEEMASFMNKFGFGNRSAYIKTLDPNPKLFKFMEDKVCLKDMNFKSDYYKRTYNFLKENNYDVEALSDTYDFDTHKDRIAAATSITKKLQKIMIFTYLKKYGDDVFTEEYDKLLNGYSKVYLHNPPESYVERMYSKNNY